MTRRWALVAAAAATLAASPAAPGQEKPQRPARTDRETGRQVEETGVAAGAADAKVMRAIAREESKYRLRRAKLDRLRRIAEENGNETLLARVDELERKHERLHQRKTARWRERLGRDRFERVERTLQRGRARTGPAAGRGKGAPAVGGKPVEGPLERTKRRGETRGGPATGTGTGGGPDDERDAPAGRGKPSDRGKGAAPGKGRKEDTR